MSLETLNQGATDWDKFAPPVEDVRRKQESVDNTPEPSPIYKNIDGGAIEGGGVEENVKAATEELRARREANAGPVVDDPILEWSGSDFRENGAHESPANQVKRASEGMTNWRKTQLGQQYLKGWGVEKTDAEAFAIADNAAALGRKPSQDPISKTLPVDDQGNVIQPLDDKQPLRETDAFTNLREATRSVSNYRELAELEAAQLRQEFAQSQEQAQVEASPVEQQPAVQTAAPTQTPTQTPDALAQEKAALNQKWVEAAAHAEFARMSAEERRAFDAVVAWDRWAAKQPELQDNTKFAELQQRVARGDQAAAGRLAQYQKAFAAKQGWAKEYSRLNQSRVTAQIQLEHRQAEQNRQQYDQAKTQVDEQFNAWLTQEHPSFAKGKWRDALNQAAREYVRNDLKLSAEEQRVHWEQTGWLRNLPAQKSIALAAMQRLAQTRRGEVLSKRVMPVQGHSPGVFMDMRADNSQEIRALERQLEGATERQGLRIAAALTRLKRASGQL